MNVPAKKPLTFALGLICAIVAAPALLGEDWPEWRGKGRLGVWTETGVLESFPDGGLRAAWRVPVHRGYAGPSVADGRVFLTEFEPTQGNQGMERVICLDEQTGERLWQREWEADYTGLEYDLGPRATPTVDGDRVYVLGAAGDLLCLRVEDGSVLWRTQYQRDYGATLPTWGFAGAPLVDGSQLIALVGGERNAKVVSFDKLTGNEIWRALSSDWEPGYVQPIIFETGGVRQLIIWQPRAVSSLDPATGKVYWEQPYEVNMGMTLATPVLNENRLLVSSFYNGARFYRLNDTAPAAELIWKGDSDSEIATDGLHAVVTTPVIDGDYIYGICSYGQLRALDARTGERIWETFDLTGEEARWASAQIVRHGDRYFINNDRGELIIARLSPEGYEEIDRTKVIDPTSPVPRRRELGAVSWTHPAYANRHMIIRNDKEVVRYSLEAQ